MKRAGVLELGARYAAAGHRHGGWLGCAPDVYASICDEADDLRRGLDGSTLRPAAIYFTTVAGTVTVVECDLPLGRCTFLPNAPPDERWRLHTLWVP